MRGRDEHNETLFSFVQLENRVPRDHPLRTIRRITNQALASLSGQFEVMYAETGRPSIPPERLLRALLLQAFFTIRSERQLMEQLDYNLLFRWFVGLSVGFCQLSRQLGPGLVAGSATDRLRVG
jgi:transposase